jgi:hypothetical protein
LPGSSSAVVVAAVLVALEGFALVAAGLGYAVVGVVGDAETVAGAELGAVLIAGIGGLLLIVARGLSRRRAWALSPAVVVQLFVLLAGVNLLVGGQPVGVPLLLVGGTTLFQLFRPEAREALGREA